MDSYNCILCNWILYTLFNNYDGDIMSKAYDTEKEAQVVLEKNTQEALDRFCPMIQKTCERNCVCFVEGQVTEEVQYIKVTDDGEHVAAKYFVRYVGCDNPMLVRE